MSRQDIQSGLNAIVNISQDLLRHLKERERRVRLASAFLTGILVFIVAAVSSFIVSQSAHFVEIRYLRVQIYLIQNLILAVALVGASALAGLLAGIVTYVLLKRRHQARLKDLAILIAEMSKEAQQANISSSHGITDSALSLLDQIMTLLPEVVRKRNQDSLLFGVVAFTLAVFATESLEISAILGALTWLYFRYENRKTYKRSISKLGEQRKIFEQQKSDLLETLSSLH